MLVSLTNHIPESLERKMSVSNLVGALTTRMGDGVTITAIKFFEATLTECEIKQFVSDEEEYAYCKQVLLNYVRERGNSLDNPNVLAHFVKIMMQII